MLSIEDLIELKEINREDAKGADRFNDYALPWYSQFLERQEANAKTSKSNIDNSRI